MDVVPSRRALVGSFTQERRLGRNHQPIIKANYFGRFTFESQSTRDAPPTSSFLFDTDELQYSCQQISTWHVRACVNYMRSHSSETKINSPSTNQRCPRRMLAGTPAVTDTVTAAKAKGRVKCWLTGAKSPQNQPGGGVVVRVRCGGGADIIPPREPLTAQLSSAVLAGGGWWFTCQARFQGDMAAAAARCLRSMPTAISMLHLSRSRTPSTTIVGELLPRAGCPTQQAALQELTAKLVRRTGVVGADGVAWSAGQNERHSAVMPTLEAVNRNARRPKKVRCVWHLYSRNRLSRRSRARRVQAPCLESVVAIEASKAEYFLVAFRCLRLGLSCCSHCLKLCDL